MVDGLPGAAIFSGNSIDRGVGPIVASPSPLESEDEMEEGELALRGVVAKYPPWPATVSRGEGGV